MYESGAVVIVFGIVDREEPKQPVGRAESLQARANTSMTGRAV